MNLHQHIRKSVQVLCHRFVVKLYFVMMIGMVAFGIASGIAAPQAHASASYASVDQIITSVFGADAPAARRIAMCESTMNPGATNTQAIGGSHAAGLFQILYPSTWNTTSQAGRSPYDPVANTIAAHDIFVRDGHSWREWQCHP